MTYDARERSIQDASPVKLYTFARNAQVWRFTSADKDITFEGELYQSITISRTGIETTTESARNAIKITTTRDMAVADLYRVSPPTDVIAVTVRRFHRGETDVAVVWIGRVLNVEWSSGQATMNCEPASTSLKRTGLRRIYSRNCSHVLYGEACGLDKANFAVTGEVTDIDGVTITVSGTGSGAYAGGFVEFEVAEGNIERRFVRSYDAGVLTLNTRFQGLEVGDTVTVYLGCNHTTTACREVFGNLPNYGGFPFIPTKNPFSGTPIY